MKCSLFVPISFKFKKLTLSPSGLNIITIYWICIRA
jgi:hypothetical protein